MKEGSDGVPSWWGSVSGAFAAFGDVEEEEKEEAAAKKQSNREENCARPPLSPALACSFFLSLLLSPLLAAIWLGELFVVWEGGN
jgi:hypothetical protein